MQKIARELSFSESSFVSPADAGHTRRVRIITPNDELPFAGHPDVLGPELPLERVAAALSLSPGDFGAGAHARRVVSVGLPFLFAELRDLDALARIRIIDAAPDRSLRRATRGGPVMDPPSVTAVHASAAHAFRRTTANEILLVAGPGVAADATRPNLGQVRSMHSELRDELRGEGVVAAGGFVRPGDAIGAQAHFS